MHPGRRENPHIAKYAMCGAPDGFGGATYFPRLPLLDHLLDALKGPVKFFAGNDQRRRNPDYAVVRFFAEEAFFFQRLAVRPRRAVQFDANPEAATAHLFQIGAAQGAQFLQEVAAQFLRALGQFFFDQDVERCPRHGAGQRIASESAAVVTGMEHAQNLLGREHCRDRIKAAGKRFADDDGVRPDAFMHVGEQLAGAAEARLDLVGNQEHAILLADGRCFFQESGGRNHNAGFSLNGLDQERTGVWSNRAAQRSRVAVGNNLEPRRERAEAVAVLLVGREADNGYRASVEIVGARNDLGLIVRNALDLVPPLAGGLDRGLHSFRSGVHGQRHIEAGKLMQLLEEQRQLVVTESARSERDFVRLLHQGVQDLGMAVALVHGGIRCEAIQILFAFHVIDPAALGAVNDDIERVVVMSSVLFFELNEFLGLVLFFDGGHVGSLSLYIYLRL